MPLEVVSLIAGRDNYVHVIVSGTQALAVDPGESRPVLEMLGSRDLALAAVLLTHHHSDHTAGAPALKNATGCTVIAPVDPRLHKADRKLRDGEEIEIAGLRIRALSVPGHTRSHAAFYLPREGCLFTGDTLFAAGCGKLFECAAREMFASLKRLAELPDETAVYCGHEYTEENLRFALTVEPGNGDIAQQLDYVRKNGRGVPTTIGLEKRTNPFLRTGSPEIRATLGMSAAPDVEVFANLRSRKDRF